MADAKYRITMGETGFLLLLNDSSYDDDDHMSKTLITLDAANAAAIAAYWNKNPTAPNGIACPSCNQELWDSTPGESFEPSPSPANAFYSTPPQTATLCKNCGFHTNRYV